MDFKLVLGLYTTSIPYSGSKPVITKVFLLALMGLEPDPLPSACIFVNDCCKPITLLDHGGGSKEDFPLEKWVLSSLNSLTKPAIQRLSCSPAIIVITVGSSLRTFQGWSVRLLRQDLFITLLWNLCGTSRAQVLDLLSTVQESCITSKSFIDFFFFLILIKRIKNAWEAAMCLFAKYNYFAEHKLAHLIKAG